MLLDGEVTSIDTLAHQAKLDRGHIGRTLNLAFLNPAITRAIMREEQPPGLRLTHLLGADIPLSWSAQNAMLQSLNAGQPRRSLICAINSLLSRKNSLIPGSKFPVIFGAAKNREYHLTQ